MDDAAYAQVMLTIAQGFELVAAGVLVVGLIFATFLAARSWWVARDGRVAYRVMRQAFVPQLQPRDRDRGSATLATSPGERRNRHPAGGG